jgi:hypothetical protein
MTRTEQKASIAPRTQRETVRAVYARRKGCVNERFKFHELQAGPGTRESLLSFEADYKDLFMNGLESYRP